MAEVKYGTVGRLEVDAAADRLHRHELRYYRQ